MRKRLWCVLFSLLLAGGMVGCAPFSSQKQTATFLDVFDTVSTVTVYGVSAEQFAKDQERLHERLMYYHRLYDIYESYDGVVNLHSVNAAAGQSPVTVETPIIDLLEYGKEACRLTGGRVNIAFGAVLSLWHDCRTAALENPSVATLPDADALRTAKGHVSPDALLIDRAASTVQITDAQMRLDVGAVAKGYAVEQVARFAERELGWTSALLNVGGNVRAIGGKGNAGFIIGIQNPDTDSAVTYLQKVSLRDAAVVTSGDYQRYYEVDGHRYSHIIDVDTLYPATYVRSVSVICPDSALADVLSTALFTLPVDKGTELLKSVGTAEAIWVLSDGSVQHSAGVEDFIV